MGGSQCNMSVLCVCACMSNMWGMCVGLCVFVPVCYACMCMLCTIYSNLYVYYVNMWICEYVNMWICEYVSEYGCGASIPWSLFSTNAGLFFLYIYIFALTHHSLQLKSNPHTSFWLYSSQPQRCLRRTWKWKKRHLNQVWRVITLVERSGTSIHTSYIIFVSRLLCIVLF